MVPFICTLTISRTLWNCCVLAWVGLALGAAARASQAEGEVRIQPGRWLTFAVDLTDELPSDVEARFTVRAVRLVPDVELPPEPRMVRYHAAHAVLEAGGGEVLGDFEWSGETEFRIPLPAERVALLAQLESDFIAGEEALLFDPAFTPARVEMEGNVGGCIELRPVSADGSVPVDRSELGAVKFGVYRRNPPGQGTGPLGIWVSVAFEEDEPLVLDAVRAGRYWLSETYDADLVPENSHDGAIVAFQSVPGERTVVEIPLGRRDDGPVSAPVKGAPAEQRPPDTPEPRDLRCVLLDDRGDRVDDETIWLRRTCEDHPCFLSGTTDGNGELVLRDAVPGRYVAMLDSSSYGFTEDVFVDVPPGEGEWPVGLPATRTGRVDVTLEFPEGAPDHPVRVTVTHVETKRTASVLVEPYELDDTVRIYGALPGRSVVSVALPPVVHGEDLRKDHRFGWFRWTVEAKVEPGTSTSVDLIVGKTPRVHLRGRVDMPTLPAQHRYAVARRDGAELASCEPDEIGRFDLWLDDIEGVTVSVELFGGPVLAAVPAQDLVASGRRATIRIAPGWIHVTPTERARRALGGATRVAVRSLGTGDRVSAEPSYNDYEFPGLEPGTYEVFVERYGTGERDPRFTIDTVEVGVEPVAAGFDRVDEPPAPDRVDRADSPFSPPISMSLEIDRELPAGDEIVVTVSSVPFEPDSAWDSTRRHMHELDVRKRALRGEGRQVVTFRTRDGRSFEVQGMPTRAYVLVRARSDFVNSDWLFWYDPYARPRSLDLTARVGACVELRAVFDPHTTELERADLDGLWFLMESWGDRTRETVDGAFDEEGRCVLTGVQAGTYTVSSSNMICSPTADIGDRVKGAGSSPFRLVQDLTFRAVPAQRLVVEAQVEEGRRLRGQVRHGGKGLEANVLVEMNDGRRGWHSTRARTGEDGWFELEGLLEYVEEIEIDGGNGEGEWIAWQPEGAGIQWSEDEPLMVDLDDPIEVDYLVGSPEGQPVVSATVMTLIAPGVRLDDVLGPGGGPTELDGKTRSSVRTPVAHLATVLGELDHGGRFIDAPKERPATVQDAIWPLWYALSEVEPAIDAKAIVVPLELKPVPLVTVNLIGDTALLTGLDPFIRLIDEVAEATEGDLDWHPRNALRPEPLDLLWDADARAFRGRLLPGAYIGEVGFRSGLEGVTAPVGVNAFRFDVRASEVHVDVPLVRGRDVTGVVVDASGDPVPGVEIGVVRMSEWPQGYGRTTADGSGAFRLPNLVPGDYRVTVKTADNKTLVYRFVEVPAGQGPWNIVLNPDPPRERKASAVDPTDLADASSDQPLGRIEGTLSPLSSRAVPWDARVVARHLWTGGEFRSECVNLREFQMDGLLPGLHHVFVALRGTSDPDPRFRPVLVRVEEGPTTARIKLESEFQAKAVAPPRENGVRTLPEGSSSFTFEGWAGPDLRVWTHVPSGTGPDTPVLLVMHGTNRDGDRYRDEWVQHADEHGLILVVPEFPKSDFPGSRGYNLGFLENADGAPRPRELWSFAAIEPLFDEVRRRTATEVTRYSIYGHSAGAQFVHRYVTFMASARVERAIAANAGWYTMPDPELPFPYGLGDEEVSDHFLAAPLTILLGTEDNDPEHKHLRRTPEAMAQGPHRLARGQAYVSAGRARADNLGVPFGWELRLVEGVGHSNGKMAAFAARLIGRR